VRVRVEKEDVGNADSSDAMINGELREDSMRGFNSHNCRWQSLQDEDY